MEKISGLKISDHDNSKRIINIEIEDEIIERLIFPFKKFGLSKKNEPITKITKVA